MTATCTLCGTLLTSEPDAILDDQRDDRTFGRLGAILRKHIHEHHYKDQQTITDSTDLKGANIEQFIGIVGITGQAATMFSYVTCEDPAFQLRIQKMKEIVLKAIEQKEIQSVAGSSLVVG